MTNKGKGKGKEIAGKASAGKRKLSFDDDKTGGGRKRNNRGVLQFFEDAADVDESDDFSDFSDDDDDSDFADDFFDEDFDAVPRTTNGPAKDQSSFPYVPKEEMMDEEEYRRIVEERLRDPSRTIRFADEFDDDKVIDPSSIRAGANELIPTIWKVKCTVGRERLSAFCLMQKFADLNSLGTTLKIISAFAVDHMKGFVYIEADKQYDINEACQGIPGIYATRVAPVPNSEVHHLFSVRSRTPEISEGMWARIKGGNYKGDLAQVVAVNNTRKKITVKLIPRIDLQALAAKFVMKPGGGYSRQKIAVPAPRLISPSELEEFRPLIQFKRDRDTGKIFEVLDGLMLKDGYVYKKLSPDSLSLWGVVPTQEELLKFGPSENNESNNDLEWLSQLYGEKKKKRVIRPEKGGGKGESSSGSGVVNGFELYDLHTWMVPYELFLPLSPTPTRTHMYIPACSYTYMSSFLTNLCHCSKKDFGLIVGMDKDDIYKILKEGSDGPVAVTIERNEIKSGLFDLKLTALDQHSKTILVNDTVKVLDGPSKDKQGIVKHIYRGIVFLYDGNEEENGGYFTCKSNMCEKVKLAVGDCSGKDSEPGPLVFEDQPSSPRSPLSPKKPWQARENNREFNRGDNNNLFTIGQTLRIRIGPLKGYLCRVIALRRSDVTVKLDSQQKVLTVKCEHLSEVQGKSTAISTSGDRDSSSKPFDLLGTDGSSGGWMSGVGTSAGGGGWNAGGASSESYCCCLMITFGRDAWSNHSASSFLKPESTSNPFSSKGAEDTAWGAAVEKIGIASNPDQSGVWGNGGGSWGQAEHKTGSVGDDNQNSNWNNKPNNMDGNQPSGWDSKSNWNTTKASGNESSGWNNVQKSNETSTGWGDGNGFKSGSDEGNLQSTWSGWKSGTSEVKEVRNPAGTSDIDGNQDAGWNNKSKKDGSESSGWETKNNWNALLSSSHDKDEKGKDHGGLSAGKASDGSAAGFSQTSGWKGGLSEEAREGSNWGNKKFGSSTVAEDNGWGKASNWNSVSGDAGGNQGNGWGQRSNWKSGSENENQNSHWSSGNTEVGIQDSNLDKKSSWNSGNSGNNGNWKTNKSSWGAGNENKNSNWSSGHTDLGNQDSNQGKKSNWNSGNSGNQASDPNNSNWNSGSGDSNQNSNWGNNSNWNSNKSSWSAGNENKNSNWSSGHTDTGNKDSNWGKKSNWNSGSGDTNQNSVNEGSNENSDGVGGGNWRGGYQGRGGSDRGGFRGRGFRGRGERGGFGGRGERGGFGGRGRSEREGFGGRWGSARGRGGRGRGRSDQSGGWNNRRDSGEEGSSDWKKGVDNVEGWKNSNRSQAWSQDTGDKDRQSWSQENADKERPSWNQGCGSKQSWSSASGGANDNSNSNESNWNQGGGSKPSWGSASGGTNDKSNNNGSSWNQGG
ncbi:Protein RNA-directed DNA methylation 3, partial [Mucuna pruriens]